MFGYVRIAKPELKVKEYELYKAIYCSLCRNLGKNYGVISRLTLSYDFTFLALLNSALKEGCDEFEKKRCPFNPTKKCNFCKNGNTLDLPAAAAMLMVYYKLLDNAHDERGLKKIGFKLLLPFFIPARNKAARSYPMLQTIIVRFVEEQAKLEKENCDNLDRAADPTAKALADIFRLCSEDEAQKRILSRLGYCIGRYIYLLDAACDLEEDTKHNRYNVLKYFSNGKTKEEARKKTEPQLYVCANEAAKAFELLDIKKYKEILGNIIYLGLEETFKKELNV